MGEPSHCICGRRRHKDIVRHQQNCSTRSLTQSDRTTNSDTRRVLTLRRPSQQWRRWWTCDVRPGALSRSQSSTMKKNDIVVTTSATSVGDKSWNGESSERITRARTVSLLDWYSDLLVILLFPHRQQSIQSQLLLLFSTC